MTNPPGGMITRDDVAPLGTQQVDYSMLPKAEQAAYRMGHHAGRKLVHLGQPSVNRLDGKMRPTLAAAWRRGYADGHEGAFINRKPAK